MRILFVCAGNICRSPIAEYLFNQMAEGTGHCAESSGLAAWSGEPISEYACSVLLEDYSIDARDHHARMIDSSQVKKADLVLTMNRRQRDHLRYLMPGLSERISTIGEAASLPNEEVDDPYGRSQEVYRNTAQQLHTLISQILAAIFP